jgi:hypothetical protein
MKNSTGIQFEPTLGMTKIIIILLPFLIACSANDVVKPVKRLPFSGNWLPIAPQDIPMVDADGDPIEKYLQESWRELYQHEDGLRFDLYEWYDIKIGRPQFLGRPWYFEDEDLGSNNGISDC